MQYEARRRSYASRASALPAIIMVDELPAGSVWLWSEDEFTVVADIAVLPQYQCKGIASVVLAGVISECRQNGNPVRLTVASDNEAAIRLYRRLGFQTEGESDLDLTMVLTTAAAKEVQP
jgi:ribosomal protein S18 acetylase RimI-like enzyme